MQTTQTKTLTIFLTMMLISVNTLSQTCKDYIPDLHPDSRYTNNNNGTITDKETGLMWKRCVEGKIWSAENTDCSIGTDSTINWQTALGLGGSSFAGHNDWRLPNIKELSTIAKRNCYNPAINETMFPNVSTSLFWSSSPLADYSDNAWQLYFYYGNDYDYYRSDSYRVRLVRLGE